MCEDRIQEPPQLIESEVAVCKERVPKRLPGFEYEREGTLGPGFPGMLPERKLPCPVTNVVTTLVPGIRGLLPKRVEEAKRLSYSS